MLDTPHDEQSDLLRRPSGRARGGQVCMDEALPVRWASPKEYTEAELAKVDDGGAQRGWAV